MTYKKAVLMQALILSAFLSVPAVSASSSPSMGMGGRPSGEGPRGSFQGGESGEKPPTPTVEGCVERTGKTEAECETMIANFGESRPEENRNGEGRPSASGNKEGTALRMKRSLSEVFDKIRERIEKTITFLKEKDVATGDLESAFAVLKEKMTAAETAHETYRTAFATWEADKTDSNKEALESARTSAKAAADAVRTYYHETVLPLVKTALESVS